MSEQQLDPQPAPRSLRFTTHGIAPVNRVQSWEGHDAKALISLDIRTIDESPLQASELNLHFPYLRLARVRGSAQVVERSETFIRNNPTDVVAVFFALEGDAFFLHRGGHESLKPGQAVMYDADLPFMRGFSRGLQELVLTLPRTLYSELTGGRTLNQPLVFDFGDGARAEAQALAGLVRRTLDPQRGGSPSAPEVGPETERTALELLRVLLARGGADSRVGYAAAAKDYIERHLGHPGLSTPEVAAAGGISERQLARAFADAGLTLSHYVRARRLDRAWEIFTAPENDRLTIGELAAGLGFASQSHFSRAFKERFEVTPLRVRKDARTGLLLGAPPPVRGNA